MTMEIIITNPTEGQYLQNIDFNYEELKKAISESVSKYDNLIYSDEQIKTAKADRANLNKFIDVLDSKRKEIKAKCLAPYTDFENKIKELQELVKTPVGKIDTQIKTYDDGKKAEKRTAITQYFNLNAGNIADLIPLEKIFDERWLNSSFSMANVEKDIDTKVGNINNDLKALSALNSEFLLQIKDKYLQILNLSAALQEKTRLEEQQAKLKAFEEAKQQKVIDVSNGESLSQAREGDIIRFGGNPVEPPKEEKLQQIDFRVWITNEQKIALKEFFTTNNIKYGAVK